MGDTDGINIWHSKIYKFTPNLDYNTTNSPIFMPFFVKGEYY